MVFFVISFDMEVPSMKKLVFWLCLLAMMLTGIASAEYVETWQSTAAPERVSGPYQSGAYEYYLLADGTVEISSYSARKENATKSSLTIASVLDGYRVSSIGRLAIFADEAESVTIPNSITNVVENPFNTGTDAKLKNIVVSPDHPTLALIDGVLFNKTYKRLLYYPTTKTNTAYTIPTGIREIAYGAFFCNPHIKSITIPDSVTITNGSPIHFCYKLNTINVSDTHPCLRICDGALVNTETNTLLAYPGGRTAVDYTVPDGITTIAASAFIRARVGTIILPDSVKYIERMAFHASHLAYIYLPDGLSYIGSSAFNRNDNLVSLRIPASVTYIDDDQGFYSLIIDPDSYAEQYAITHDIPYQYPAVPSDSSGALDWLLN